MRLIELVKEEMICGDKRYDWVDFPPSWLNFVEHNAWMIGTLSPYIYPKKRCAYKGNDWFIYSVAFYPGSYFIICPVCLTTTKITTMDQVKKYPYLENSLLDEFKSYVK